MSTRFWSCCLRTTTKNGKITHQYKWEFSVVIMLLGTVATALVLWLGLNGVYQNSEQQFVHEATQLTNVLSLSWQGYETLALWIHESCHFNIYDSSGGLEQFYFNTTDLLSNLSKDNHPDDLLALRKGFCSREKFTHIHQHLSSLRKSYIAIQYIPNITHSFREEVEEESRLFMSRYKPEFEYQGIRDYLAYPNATVKAILPSPKRPFYFPIHYLEPVDRNEPALDLDMYSFRKNEIDKAIATNQPVLGPRAKLIQEDVPDVYAVELIHPGLETHIVGDLPVTDAVSKIVIRIPDLIRQAAESTVSMPKSVYIFDETPHRTVNNGGKPVFLAGADILCKRHSWNLTNTLKREIQMEDIINPRHTYTTTIQAADHTWRIIVHGTEEDYDVVWQIVGGVAIMVGCLLLVVAFHSNLNRVAKMHEMKNEAEAEKAEMAFLQARRETHLNDFIAHEVRNPLSSAIAALSFVNATTQERVHDDETKEALLGDIRILDSSLQYINDLLRNMLDIHRTASKKMKLDESPTDILTDIFQPVKSILRVKQNKATILIDCPEQLIVLVDRLRVKQIVLNLAINSTKFVNEGFIRLRAGVEKGKVVLFVEDSGPGIRPEQRDRLFNKFQESFDLLSQGTGIGLHICKSLSDLMGADLYLDDDYNSGYSDACPGARFVLELHKAPIRQHLSLLQRDRSKVEEDHSSASPSDETCTLSCSISDSPTLPESLTVLFVDDDFILRKLFSRTVKRAAPTWKVYEASNGETALSLIEENKYDLIFVDQYMASVEKQLLGTETVRELRQKCVTCAICGLSANDLKDQFLEAGSDAFILKPFPCETEKLQRELELVLIAGLHAGRKFGEE